MDLPGTLIGAGTLIAGLAAWRGTARIKAEVSTNNGRTNAQYTEATHADVQELKQRLEEHTSQDAEQFAELRSAIQEFRHPR